MMQRLQFSNSSQLPTWTFYLPSQNSHNCFLVDINSNNIRSVCQADRALLMYSQRPEGTRNSLARKYFRIFFRQIYGKIEVFNQFCLCYIYFQTYYLCLTQEQRKKCLTLQEQQEVHHILLNRSLSPKSASLLLLIPIRTDLRVMCPRTRQWPSCPASQTHSQKQQCTHACPNVPSVKRLPEKGR